MKIRLLYFTLLSWLSMIGAMAQTLNQDAAWPNTNWTVTGTYSTDPAAFEADPTLTSNFAFDDDDAGGGSDDSIAAESPVIDLTAASAAGESWITVTGDYVYNDNGSDILQFEYWDADASTWNLMGSEFTADTSGAPLNDFCSGTNDNYTTDVLDISSFTATQLSGFRYRIFYDDNPAGSGWQWGFCFSSPTITSAVPPTCITPTSLTVDNVTMTTVDLSWVQGDASTTSYDVLVVPTGTGATGSPTQTAITGTTATISNLISGEVYDAYVRAVCNVSDTSDYSDPVTFRNPGQGDSCSAPVSLTVNSFGDCTSVYNLDFEFAVDLGTTDASCDAVGTNTGRWFEFTAPAEASIVLNSIGTTVEFAIFDACGGNQLECVSTATSDSGIITGLTAGNNYKLMVWKDGTPSITTDICLQAGPTCLEPNALDATNITDTTADLSWTSGGSGETAWDIEIVNVTAGQTVTGTPQINGITNPYQLTGLTPANVYDYYVRADCGGGDSSTFAGPFQFRTSGPLDNCATAQTLTVEADCAGATPFTLDLATAGDLGALTGCDSGGTNTGGWFEFTTGTVTTVTINTSVAMKLQILDACGGAEIACESTSSTSHIVSGLMASTNYKMAMWVDGTSSNSTDICIEEGPTCFVPTDIEASNVTQTSADLSWTAPSQGTTPVGYNVEVVTAGTPPTGTPTDLNVVSGFTKSGLSTGTEYDVYVYSDCGNGDLSEVAGPISFMTSPACGTVTVDSGGATGDYGTNELVVITFYPDDPANVAQLQFDYVDLEVRSASAGTFWDIITIYDGLDTSAPVLQDQVPLVDVNNGDNPLFYTATNAEGALTFEFDSDFTTNAGGYEFIFNCIVRPTCLLPSALDATIVDDTTAELSWTAGASMETMWDIEVVLDGATPTGTPTENDVTTNPYTLSNLMPGTRYEYYLRADCGNATSGYVGPFAFRTSGPGDTSATAIGLTVETACDVNTQTLLDFTNALEQGDVATCSSIFDDNRGVWYQFRPNRNTSAVFLNSSEEVQYALFSTDSNGDVDSEIQCGTLSAATQLEVGGLDFRSDYKLVIYDDTDSLVSTNICIENGPSCPTPLSLEVTSVSSTTVDLSWTPSSTSQNLFNVLVFNQNDDPTTATPVFNGTSTTTTTTVTGLSSSTNYDAYIQADCGAGDTSSIIGPVTFSTSPACGDTVYDSGGPNGNYSNSNLETYVFVPDNITDNAQLEFLLIDMETCCDEILIYDGLDTNAPLINGDVPDVDVAGGDAPIIFTATNPDGALTLVLDPDGSITSAGFEVLFNCVPRPTCQVVSNLGVSNISSVGADISWDLNDPSQNLFEIEITDQGVAQDGSNVITGVTASPFTINTLMSGTGYDAYVRADCGNGDFSDWVGPITFSTSPACGDTVYDSGGPNGNYANSNLETYVFVPDNITDNAQLEFLLIDMETCCDEILIYDGLDINAPLINGDVPNVDVAGGDAPIIFTATNPDGALTLVLDPDGSITGAGFEVLFNCVPRPTCQVVSNLGVSNISSVGADISWDLNDPSQNLFEIEITDQGVAQDGSNVITGVTASPFTINTLMSGTNYDAYVRADCGNGDFSDWTGPISFNTRCSVINAPYFTDFENFTEDREFTDQNCWSQTLPNPFEWQIDTNGGTTSGSTGPSGAFSGSAFMYSEASSPADTGDIAIVDAPEIDLSTISSPGLSFYYHMYGSSIVSLTVQVSTDSGSTFTQVDQIAGEQQTDNSDPWLLREIDLTPFANQVIIVRFLSEIQDDAAGFAFNGDIAIDDFRIDTTASTPGLDQASEISLYPNPVSGDILNLDMGTNVSGEVNIMIHNTLGQIVRRESMRSSSTIELDGMSTLSDGMYFITVDTGGKQQTIKFLKE